MKELSIEEKAKRYDKAVERAKEQLDKAKVFDYKEEQIAHDIRTTAYAIFPELKESEDEMIRKELIFYFQEEIPQCSIQEHADKMKEFIAWLEKQGEQKPAWSEEDEMFVHGLIRGLAAKKDIHGHTTFSSDCIDITETIDWLKSLKDRVQPKQEWSEEDEERLSDAIFFVREYQIPTRDKRLLNAAKETEDWLRTLRPQNTWKPSEEQMEALDDFIYAKYPNVEKYGAAVKSLCQDLKKLREE